MYSPGYLRVYIAHPCLVYYHWLYDNIYYSTIGYYTIYAVLHDNANSRRLVFYVTHAPLAGYIYTVYGQLATNNMLIMQEQKLSNIYL